MPFCDSTQSKSRVDKMIQYAPEHVLPLSPVWSDEGPELSFLVLPHVIVLNPFIGAFHEQKLPSIAQSAK